MIYGNYSEIKEDWNLWIEELYFVQGKIPADSLLE